jgi:hypothetical protein
LPFHFLPPRRITLTVNTRGSKLVVIKVIVDVAALAIVGPLVDGGISGSTWLIQ